MITASQLLARGPRYAFARWLDNGRNWTKDDVEALTVLADAAVPLNTASDILGRAPTTLAWKARELRLRMPADWSNAIKLKRPPPPKSPRLRQRGRPNDLTGQRYGALVVKEFTGRSTPRGRHRIWRCQCDCGQIVEVRSCALRAGYHLSCGCKRKTTAFTRATELTQRLPDGHFATPKRRPGEVIFKANAREYIQGLQRAQAKRRG